MTAYKRIMFISNKSQLGENHERQLHWSHTKHTQPSDGAQDHSAKGRNENKVSLTLILHFRIIWEYKSPSS